MRIYMQLDYDDYKRLEGQILSMKERETTHTSVGDDPDNSRFYHKSMSIQVGDGVQLEFHGPNVAASS